MSQTERSSVENVRIEYSDRYGYLYFYFSNGRVIGIPYDTPNPAEGSMQEGMDSLVTAVCDQADNVVSEMHRVDL